MKKSRRRLKKPKPRTAEVPPASASSGMGRGGLLNPPQPGRPASDTMKNQFIRAAEEKLEAGITARFRPDYDKVVRAGLRVALKDGSNGLLASLQHSEDPLRDCAIGAVNLTMMLYKQSRNTMPPQALAPGAMTLMLEALDFVDRARIMEIGKEELDRATHEFANRIMAVFHVTPSNLRFLSDRVHRVMQDPSKVEMMARRSGVVKSPLASTPTEAAAATPVEE